MPRRTPPGPEPGPDSVPHATTRARTVARLLVAMVLGLLVVVAAAGPASAHAALLASDPPDGSVLDEAPEVAGFTFNEPVSATVGAVRIFDDTGARVDDGVLGQPSEDRVTVGLGELDAGGYVATYRVTSLDGHVIRGALTFRIGTGSALDDATVAAVFAGGDGVVQATATVVRAIDLAAVLVAVGAMATLFGAVVRPDHRRLARQTARFAARTGIVAALLDLPLQAMASSGLGVGALVSGSVWSDTLVSSVGLSALTRAVGLVLVLAVVEAVTRADDRSSDDATPVRGAGRLAGAGAAVLALGSLLLDGHTRTVEPAAVMVVGDAVHVAAAALWAGGLVVLARILHHPEPDPAHPDPADPEADVRAGIGREPVPAGQAGQAGRTHGHDATASATGAAPVATQVPVAVASSDDTHATATAIATWSGWALWSMLAVVVAGSAMGWALVRQPRALTETAQGWTLVVKVALVVVILLVAAWNRWRLVPAVVARGGDAPAARELLRSSVRIEVVLAALVLAVTAVLVGLRPAAAEAGISGAYDTVVALDEETTLQLVVDPNRAGRNEVHLYVLDQTGRPASDVEDVTLSLEQVAEDIGPIERTPEPAGAGHWVLDGSDLAVPGPWELTTIVGVDRFTQLEATVEVVVNPG